MARIVPTQEIICGPGKFDLMLALFAGKEVVFTMENGQKLTVRISSVQREDGSSESWNLEGEVMNCLTDRKFVGYYSTRRNKGVRSF